MMYRNPLLELLAAAMHKAMSAALALAALTVPSIARSQPDMECNVQELLRNDENYFSEVKYTLQESCRRRLLDELATLAAPSAEQRYLLVKLATVEGQENQRGQAYVQLCDVEKYARACFAAAAMIDLGQFGNRDADLMRFLEAAATNDVPVAQVYLGDLKILRFERTDSKEDFCAAMRWWGRAAKLGDSAAIRRVQKAPSNDTSHCN